MSMEYAQTTPDLEAQVAGFRQRRLAFAKTRYRAPNIWILIGSSAAAGVILGAGLIILVFHIF